MEKWGREKEDRGKREVERERETGEKEEKSSFQLSFFSLTLIAAVAAAMFAALSAEDAVWQSAILIYVVERKKKKTEWKSECRRRSRSKKKQSSETFIQFFTFDGVFAGGGTSFCAEDMARARMVAAGREGAARGREREAARRHDLRSAIRSRGERRRK